MIGVGIVGFGRIGKEHSQWIHASSSARVEAIFDPTPARSALAESLGWVTTSSLEALFDRPGVDAVLIATPTVFHFQQAMQALDAGKHVMVEKPMALDLSEATRMQELAKTKGLVLSVFHCRRWDLDYLTVREAIASGVFGNLINIESRLGQWASCVGPAAREYRPNWRNENAFGGGGLYDWGSHFLDQLWQLFYPARPVEVFAQLRGNVWSHDCDDFARVLINFDNGSVGLCEINTTTTCPLPRWHIDGTKGSAESPFSPAFNTREWAKLTYASTEGQKRELPLAKPGLTESDIWNRFAKACEENSLPAVPVDSVLITMRLLDAARESSQQGRSVRLTY